MVQHLEIVFFFFLFFPSQALRVTQVIEGPHERVHRARLGAQSPAAVETFAKGAPRKGAERAHTRVLARRCGCLVMRALSALLTIHAHQGNFVGQLF